MIILVFLFSSLWILSSLYYKFFVNHFLHNKIPDRLLINSCLNKIKNSNNNVIVITPSDLFHSNPYDFILADNIHYKNTGKNFAHGKVCGQN